MVVHFPCEVKILAPSGGLAVLLDEGDRFQGVAAAVGGVDFEVPMDMQYSDPYQDLYIHIYAGEQWLDGATAVERNQQIGGHRA